MKIDGIEVTWVSEEDGKPIKTKLPAELKERMKTANQWLEAGYVLKEDAVAYEMHASCDRKKIFAYYLDTDVEKMTSDNVPHTCMGCAIREGRWCVVAGDYVSSTHRCSEWVSL